MKVFEDCAAVAEVQVQVFGASGSLDPYLPKYNVME
jgi:hypothetical protein